ncbi:MAG TPA: tripartite tricarboxylate transporter substrate-binding protein [Xanthobacteraceae bacterium]|nr:tripartite tricarboxylate transporter substrate-binding protein [Xanthobacteraceae bacterium]
MSVGPFTRRSILSAATILAAAPAVVAPARAQSDFPTRPIHMVVGFAAGGGNDIFARLVGAKMGDILGQTVVVENKPGAAGRLSAEYVANQAADGYSLLVGASGAMAIGPAIYSDLKYDTNKTFTPIGMIANFPLILVINADNPSKNLKDFIAWMKAHPDKANYASSSPAFTIATELLKLKTGMPGTMIPYKSSNEMNLSVIQGQTAMTIADGPPTVPQVKGGKERALAVTGSERIPELPDTPTMAEAGYPSVNIQLWSGLFAPAATPKPVVDNLRKAFAQAIVDPGVSDKLKAMAVNPGGATPQEFRGIIDSDIAKYRDVVKAANLKFED